MKNTLFVFVYLLLTQFTFSQNIEDKIVFFDSIWKESTEQNHDYYRVIKNYYSMNKKFKVLDYYKSGALQMEGNFEDREAKTKTGEFVYYYKNGNKKSIENYEKSKLLGKFNSWYENGNTKIEGEYIEDKDAIGNKFKINQAWDLNNKQTVVDGNGFCTLEDKKSFSKGAIKNGFHNGVWTGHDDYFKFDFTENHQEGKFISGISIDGNNIEHKYEAIEIKPEPSRGIKDFYDYIGRTFNTTKESGDNNISGEVVASFVVEKDGSLVEIKIVQSLGYGLDEELVRVLKNCRKWNPGVARGVKVRVNYTIPVRIASSR
jgi:TonB family protein